ncbi:hypothetical protein GCM10025874_12400 [Arenivirga flava]|uniref:Uncharacterized protein n=1 Tax=Arenivirga flava TaxID=1930060 RepID=A0AA37UIU2_9MICO|nr:hypothetical protein GCM10025874_12400 [Arenivirga flava]
MLLALLGSATFWQPSLSVVIVLAAAPALAAMSSWFLLRAVSRRSWIPAAGAVAYAVSPPLLASILEGRLGAVIALAILPWLLLAAIRAIRSWTGLGAAALLGAVVAAASPSLAPPLLAAWVALLLLRPARALRLVWMPLPALGVLAPLAVAQFLRGTSLAVLADPGAAQPTDPVAAWLLALGSSNGGLHGWPAVADAFGVPASVGVVVAIVLIAPLLVLGLLGPFLPGASRSLPALLLAVLGFVAALGAGLVRVAAVEDGFAALWPGPALGLMMLGLLIAAAGTLDALGRAAAAPGLALVVGALLLAVPQLGGLYRDDAAVRAGNGRVLPAVVTAESDLEPQVGTLVLTPQSDGSLRVRLERGRGHGLEDASTFATTAPTASARDERLAELAGNIASRGGYDPAPVLREFGIDFVVLAPVDGTDPAGGGAVSTRAQQALDGSADFTMIGSSEAGLLWRTTVDDIDPATAPAAQEELSAVEPAPLRDAGLVLLALAALLAVPTRIGSPRVRESRHVEDQAEYAFGEEGSRMTEPSGDRRTRIRSVARVGGRILGGVAGLGIAGAAVLGGALPLPSVTGAAEPVVVVPEAADLLQVCAGPLLLAGGGETASTASAVGSEQVVRDVQGGEEEAVRPPSSGGWRPVRRPVWCCVCPSWTTPQASAPRRARPPRARTSRASPRRTASSPATTSGCSAARPSPGAARCSS